MGESLITIAFAEADGGATTVTTSIEYPSKEVRDVVVGSGMTDGMEMSYRHLDELLAQ